MCRVVTLEPLPDGGPGCSWNSPSALRELGARGTDDAPRCMRERRLVRIAERRVTQPATGKLRGETKHRDHAPAAGESILDGPFRGGASDSVEDVRYCIV